MHTQGRSTKYKFDEEAHNDVFCFAQEAIDKGAFRIRAGEPNEGSPNMINILRTATEIAGAMSYLHSLDILHSDLNGNNILLISNTGIDDRPFSVKVSVQSLLNFLIKLL